MGSLNLPWHERMLYRIISTDAHIAWRPTNIWVRIDIHKQQEWAIETGNHQPIDLINLLLLLLQCGLFPSKTSHWFFQFYLLVIYLLKRRYKTHVCSNTKAAGMRDRSRSLSVTCPFFVLNIQLQLTRDSYHSVK